jgi:aromatic amino acid aminotransferase I
MRKMEFEIPSLNTEDPVHAWRFEPEETSLITTSTNPASSVVAIQRALGYTTGAGLPETQAALAEFTRIFHAPPNHQVTPTLGNCDGVSKCFRLLGERGDSFLADEFSFSALTNAAVAHGIKWVPVKIDAGGLVPAELEKILAEWNEQEQGRRPHVLYTTPCGQNPTGSTLSLERRKTIYAIAQRHDLVIIEDGMLHSFLLVTWCSSCRRPLFLPAV